MNANSSSFQPDRRKSLGGVEGRSATIEAKINRLELLLSCCNSLLPMDDEVEAMRTSHRSNAFGDVVERYNRFKGCWLFFIIVIGYSIYLFNIRS